MQPKLVEKIVLPAVLHLRTGSPLPEAASGWHEAAQGWLDRVLVDWPELQRYIDLLENIYQARFDYPSRLAELPRARFGPPSGTSGQFPTVAALPEKQFVAVLDHGPGVLSDAEMAALLVHPPGLADLFLAVDDLMPTYWLRRFDATGAGDVTTEQGAPRAIDTSVGTPPSGVVPDSTRVRLSGKKDGGGLKSSQNGRWGLAASPQYALAAVVLIISVLGWAVAGYLLVTTLERARSVEQELAGLREKSEGVSRELPGLEPLIEFHAGEAERPADWEDQWKRLVDPEDLPSTNLNRIRAASGDEIRKIVDRMRTQGITDYEILAYLKWSLASPQKRTPKE